MFRSRLFRRIFLSICVLVTANAVAFYRLSVTPMRERTYQQQKVAARALLDSVYDLARSARDDIDAYKRSALEAHKRELHNLVLLQEGVIRTYYDRAQRGELTEAQAQEEVLEALRSLRYGNNDYVWVSDYSSVLLSHPDPELHRADFSDRRDIHGKLIVPPMVEIALEQGEGFTSYFWRRLDEEQPVEKLTYSRHFPEWKWVLGTGVYIDDIDREVAQRYQAVVGEMRTLLHRIRIAETGYLFILDKRQHAIIHPNPKLEGSDISGMLDPASGRPIGQELIESSRRADRELHYRWDRPDDTGNYVYEKVSWTRHLPGFGWYISSSVYKAELYAAADALRDRILFVTLGTLLLSFLAAFLFVRYLLRPIEALYGAARRVQRGDLTTRIELSRRDELGVLATAFNAMVERLRDNIAELDAKVESRTRELAQKNEELEGSLVALQAAQRHAQESEERAVEASHAKSAFLATMSHEIRTPMNAVIGMTGLLLDSKLDGEQREFVETIRESGDALLAMINDILDFSKIEAGRMELEEEPFALQPCLESALELVAPRAAEKQLELIGELDEGSPAAVIGDSTRLRQVLVNLLSNAVKFTDAGEVVATVRARPLDAGDGAARAADGADPGETSAHTIEMHCSVRDTGVGIPAEKQDRLFRSFSQVDSSTARQYGGSGLGLAICKRLVEMMGGRIWIESEPGSGSTFHFTFRTREATPLPDEVPEDLDAVIRGKRVLIVDANTTRRRVLERHLRAWAIAPQTEASAEGALDRLRRGERFDLALVDLQLPGEGAAFALELRAMHGTAGLPLILLNRRGAAERQILALPDVSVLTKPVRVSTLFDRLVEVFAGDAVMEHGTEPKSYTLDHTMAERHPLRILVAEDNAVNQKLAVGLLQRLGYRPDLAADGREVLAALRRQRYDVVLMDVQMPEMDGLEATRAIRQGWSDDECPRIVAVTANAMREDREACLAAGMDDYLSKPLSTDGLIAALARCRPLGPPAADRVAAAAPAAASRPAPSGVEGAGRPGNADRERLAATISARLGDVCGGDPHLVAEIVDTFMRESSKLLADLDTALSRGDADGLRRAAHTLKSNAASLGAARLETVSAQLERLGRAADMGNAPPLCEEAAQLLRQVQAALRTLRAEP